MPVEKKIVKNKIYFLNMSMKHAFKIRKAKLTLVGF